MVNFFETITHANKFLQFSFMLMVCEDTDHGLAEIKHYACFVVTKIAVLAQPN